MAGCAPTSRVAMIARAQPLNPLGLEPATSRPQSESALPMRNQTPLIPAVQRFSERGREREEEKKESERER